MKGHAILEAAHQVGRDGKGTDRIVGYFERLLIKWPYREPTGETCLPGPQKGPGQLSGPSRLAD